MAAMAWAWRNSLVDAHHSAARRRAIAFLRNKRAAPASRPCAFFARLTLGRWPIGAHTHRPNCLARAAVSKKSVIKGRRLRLRDGRETRSSVSANTKAQLSRIRGKSSQRPARVARPQRRPAHASPQQDRRHAAFRRRRGHTIQRPPPRSYAAPPSQKRSSFLRLSRIKPPSYPDARVTPSGYESH